MFLSWSHRLCLAEQKDKSEGRINASMCLALGILVRLHWRRAIRAGPCNPPKFPQGGVPLNDPGDTIGRQLISAKERTEGGWKGVGTPQTCNCFGFPLSCLQISCLSDKTCDYIDLGIGPPTPVHLFLFLSLLPETNVWTAGEKKCLHQT